MINKIIKVKLYSGMFLIAERDFQSLNSKGFGVSKKKDLFELDVFEVLFLLDKKKIEVIKKYNKEKLSFDDIMRTKKVNRTSYIVYKDLRSRGYVVKSGLKYGFVFRMYDKGIKAGEDHSLWLVEPILESEKLNIRSISGKNRVAHSTRKKMLFAIVDSDSDVTYLENSWKRM